MDDPETSHEASEDMTGEKAGRVELIVYNALLAIGGRGTNWQIEQFLKGTGVEIDSNTVTPRMKPLENKKYIERTSDRGPGRKGPTAQTVWRAIKP